MDKEIIDLIRLWLFCFQVTKRIGFIWEMSYVVYLKRNRILLIRYFFYAERGRGRGIFNGLVTHAKFDTKSITILNI